MKSETEIANPDAKTDGENQHSSFWVIKYSTPLLVLILALALLGGYEAFQIPIGVFPRTNFPRVLIAVNNGVMPIDQMLVAITRPIENAVNSVEGLQEVRSITSRGTAEVDLFFDWTVNMPQTLQRVDSAIATVQGSLPSTVKITAHRLTFASFPILGFALTCDTMPATQLWEVATYQLKPRLNRVLGVSTVMVQGGEVPEYQVMPDPGKLIPRFHHRP